MAIGPGSLWFRLLGSRCDRLYYLGNPDTAKIVSSCFNTSILSRSSDKKENKLKIVFESDFVMSDSRSPDFKDILIDEVIDQAVDLANRIALAMDSGSTNLENSFDDLESEIEEATKAVQHRRDTLEAKRDQIRQRFARKWKRY